MELSIMKNSKLLLISCAHFLLKDMYQYLKWKNDVFNIKFEL